MNTSSILTTLLAACSLLCTLPAAAQTMGTNPFASRAEASGISEASIIEMPLDGTGAYPMTWAGVAQYGHGPVQLVVELPRASKWLGPSCLKFITMKRQGDAYVSVAGGYVFTYESTALTTSGSYASRPDPNRFIHFERSLNIQKEDSVWEAKARMQGVQRQMSWTSEDGQVQARQDVVTSMKPLQRTPHCAI